MKTFKSYLTEGYDFFPETAAEIEASLEEIWPEEAVVETIAVLDYLKERYPNIAAPININKKETKINITRQLQDDVDLAEIRSTLGLKKIRMKFGNGSSGNRGSNNRGNQFELDWAEAIEKWWAGETVEGDLGDSVRDVVREYNLNEAKQLSVDIEGGENTRRPITFSGNEIVLKNTKGKGFDVGPTVTDITLRTDTQTIYLSLKLGGTVTFFNVGIRKILTPDEIKSGEITNKQGLLLLKTFGIDPDRFCKVFNQEDIPRSEKIDRRPKVDKRSINTLLQSGIGHGYHVIHKLRGGILSKKMDQAAMQKAAQLSDIVVYYGGKGGSGRRIDVVFESPTYKFNINIRDTQGKDGYPTRMMCDFKNK